MKKITTWLLFLFLSCTAFGQLEPGVSVNGFYSRLHQDYPVFPGSGVEFFLRKNFNPTLLEENVFLDIGLGGTYSKGFLIRGKSISAGNRDRAEILGWYNNFSIDALVKIGKKVNMRNQKLLFIAGLNSHYYPESINKGLFETGTRKLNMNLMIEPGIYIRQVRFLNSVHVFYVQNMFSFLKNYDHYYKRMLGMSIKFQL